MLESVSAMCREVFGSRASEPRSSLRTMWPVAAGLIAYSLLVTLLTGDIGFEGDDWWIFGWSYWNSFPYSIVVYAKESLRPIEGVYWLTVFELFGFNKTAFHFLSLLLLAGASLAMGLSLLKAFPHLPGVALAASLFAFFLPTVSCLTYVMTTDNSRLSVLLFWSSVLAFQMWAKKSGSWAGLVAPVCLYQLAFLTYEAPSLLIFVTPLLVAPMLTRGRLRVSARSLMVRLAAAIAGNFMLAMTTRFLFLNGGAVTHRHVLPPWDLLWGYPALLPFYLLAPFRHVPGGWPSLIVGLSAMGWAFWIILSAESWKLPGSRQGQALFAGAPEEGRQGGRLYHNTGRTGLPAGHHMPWDHLPTISALTTSPYYVAALGVATLILGMLPYQMAGYGSVIPTLKSAVLLKWGLIPQGDSTWFNFNWSSRIYSAGTFGLAILFGVLVCGWKAPALRKVAAIVAAAAIGLYAAFHASMIPEWKEAARIRGRLCADLVRQIPGVLPGTNFLFLGMDARYERAVVFRGWMGLKALTRMLYDDATLNAWYLYPCGWKWPNLVFQQGFVTPKGFVSRGMRMDRPVPLDSLIILDRSGENLALAQSITSGDGPISTGICWTEVSKLDSNLHRISDWNRLASDSRRSAMNDALRREICGHAFPSRISGKSP